MVVYVSAALRHARVVNLDRGSTDQSAYMGYARSLAESNYTYVGDRNRMPLYPILQSLAYDPGATAEEWFARGKALNIALSVCCLIGLFAMLRCHLPAAAAIALTLIVAFTVLVFKAGYFQAEILFYTLNFFSFLLMNRLLHRPSWKEGVAAGALLGLSHLTKASVIPGLALFFVVGALELAYGLHTTRRTRSTGQASAVGQKGIRSHVATWVCVGLAFLLTVGPYLVNSKRVYGQYFYNVNSTFYLWYDSWDEAKEGTRAHGDRYGWPDMPPEMIPSAGKYLREHTPAEIIGRVTNGLEALFRQAVQSYGYFKYEVVYLVSALILALAYHRHTRRLLLQHRFLWLFNALYFAAYLLLYAWFTPICSGNRLPLAQFLPLMFGLSVVIYRLYGEVARVAFRGRSVSLTTVLTVAVLFLLAYDAYDVITHRIVSMYGGS